MRLVARQLVGALAHDLDREGALLDGQLVPEVEGRGRSVEARPEVRGRRGRDSTNHRSASSTASSEASTTCAADASTASASLSPWPVTIATAVPPSSPSFVSA